MVVGQDTPDIFSTNVFEHSFKNAAACFRMIDLSNEFDTERLSKDARLMIINGLFYSAVKNNNGLLYFSVNLDFKKEFRILACPVFRIIGISLSQVINWYVTTFKNHSLLNNVYG